MGPTGRRLSKGLVRVLSTEGSDRIGKRDARAQSVSEVELGALADKGFVGVQRPQVGDRHAVHVLLDDISAIVQVLGNVPVDLHSNSPAQFSRQINGHTPEISSGRISCREHRVAIVDTGAQFA